MPKPHAEPLPYYRWYWRDWRASRAVQRMPFEARAIYRELLDECWVSGSIPDNAEQMADIVGTSPDIINTFWSHVRPMFRKKGRRLYNDRIERERTVADQLRVNKSLAGKKSAEIRRSKNSTDVEHLLNDVERIPTSSSSSIRKSSSSAARSTRTRRPVIAPAPEGARSPGPPTPISGIVDQFAGEWRAELGPKRVT